MAGYEDAQSKLYPQRHQYTITHVLIHFRREKFAVFVPEVFSLESGEYLSESVIVDTVRNGSICCTLRNNFSKIYLNGAKTSNYMPIDTLLGITH